MLKLITLGFVLTIWNVKGYAVGQAIKKGAEAGLQVAMLPLGPVEGGAEKVVAEGAEGLLKKEVAEAAEGTANIGNKLEYVLGNATENAHNIERSTSMLRQLENVGLSDSAETRQLLTDHLEDVVSNANNIVETQANGTVVRESLLMGPNGGVKLQTIWDDNKLITVQIFGGQ